MLYQHTQFYNQKNNQIAISNYWVLEDSKNTSNFTIPYIESSPWDIMTEVSYTKLNQEIMAAPTTQAR